MNKGLMITLQIILYILSNSILILSKVFPNIYIGVIVISSFIGFSTYYLWSKSSKDILIKSTILLTVLEFFKMYGSPGLYISQNFNNHFSDIVNWLLPSIMIIVLFILLIKSLIYENNK